MKQTAEQYWTARGFTRMCTGGNCYAWERTLRTDGLKPVQILITDYDDQETRALDDVHNVGLYLEGEGVHFDFHAARNAASAWAWIRDTLGMKGGR